MQKLKSMYPATPQDEDISTQQPVVEEVRLSFGKRLRQALEALEEGKQITLRTKEDRQTVTNAVLAVKKKKGFDLKTRLLQGRDEEGKMIIQISRPKSEATE